MISFETFRIIYLLLSILGSGFALGRLRKQRDDLVITALMSVMMFVFFFANYLDSQSDNSSDDISEFIFRALTHVRGDLVLVFCNALLWGTVPFVVAFVLKKKKWGELLVWGFFVGMTLLKTKFEDFFFIHAYPQIMQVPPFHTFEWGSVLTAWLIIYSASALFITKGIEMIEGTSQRQRDS